MFSSTIAVKTSIVTTAVAAVLAIAGCTDDSSTTATSTSGMDHGGSSAPSTASADRSDFNDADVAFLQMMYPHHAQAIDMAKLVAGRSQNQELLALAQNIESAQGPEMTQMTGLLASFGKPAPSADTSSHDMPGAAVTPGMMSAEQMKSLAASSGTAFDQRWLQMMIDHHTGAIDMANTELGGGTNPDGRALAEAIVANQQAEITQMRGMLGQG